MNLTEDQKGPFHVKDTGRWLISGRDKELLGELHKVLRCWLPCFNSADDIEKACNALRCIENLAKDGASPTYFEISVMRRSENVGGLSAEMTMSKSGICLGLTEFVWIGAQGYDHGSPTGAEGRPIRLELSPSGSFEKDMFDAWWELAMELAPEGPNDFSSVAQIKSE